LIIDVGITWELLLNTIAFENLKSVGVDLVSNDTLRVQITNSFGYDYVNIQNHERRTQKFFLEQLQPVFGGVVGSWSRNVQTDSELELVRKNNLLHIKLNSMNFYTRKKLYFLKQLQTKSDQLIINIETEIERLD